MVTEPESMDELVYYTNRKVGNGKITAWTYRGECPKCKKGLMGKPKDPKTGKPKVRATEYECPECGYTAEKEEYEDTLECEAKYTCPKCRKEGEGAVPFKRKKVMLFDEEKQKKTTVDAVVFLCSKCGEKIPVTKKLK
ncbi:hypothetical protein JW968_00350 [Candidatus Woesearchaeota archaeon]|nr:hypothetical protein [Candidatus Woesearchaeota archaeon]